MRTRAWPWIAALLVAAPVQAQGVAETITPDRPGLGDGAHVVGKGVVQLEAGTEWAFGQSNDVLSFGQGLVRYGLGALELRFQPGSATVQDENFGLTDAAFGAKIRLLGGDTRLSAVVSASVPSGADVFSSRESLGAATLVAETALSDRVGLAVNAGYGFEFDDFSGGGYTLIVTPSVAIPSKPGMSVYGGYAGFFSEAENTHIAEAGIAWAPEPDWQFDVNLGRNTESGRAFFGVGVAHRWR